MEINKIIIAEIILIFATVLIFRSAWLLLDGMSLMGETVVLWASLVLGTFATCLALRRIAKK